MVKRGIRDEICHIIALLCHVIMPRYVKANNKYMKDHDKIFIRKIFIRKWASKTQKP